MTVLIGEEDKFNKKLAALLDLKLVPVAVRTYPDYEVCPRVIAKKEVVKEDIIISLRKSVEENSNSYIMKYLLLADTLRSLTEDDSRKILGIMPYLPYARQDKNFDIGNAFEPVSIEHLIEHLGLSINEIITFTSHFQRKEGIISKYAVPIHNLDGFNVFETKLNEMDNCFVLAPDKGMRSLAEELAEKYNFEFDYIEKERDTTSGELNFKEKDFTHVFGKNVVIPDDMVSSGGTLIKCVDYVKQFKPSKITLMFVHGAFTSCAYGRVHGLNTGMLCTDTIKENHSTISVVDYLAEYIQAENLADTL